MTWPQLQAYVDEVAAKFGEKNWQVLPVPSLKDGRLFETLPSFVRFVEPKLATCEPQALRFDLAAKVGEAIVFRRAIFRGIFWTILPFSLLMAVISLLAEPLGLALKATSPTKEVIVTLTMCILYALPFLWIGRSLKTQSFLRNLLYLTEDPVRTREYLVSKKAKPVELAQLDALIREMRLESPKPAEG